MLVKFCNLHNNNFLFFKYHDDFIFNQFLGKKDQSKQNNWHNLTGLEPGMLLKCRVTTSLNVFIFIQCVMFLCEINKLIRKNKKASIFLQTLTANAAKNPSLYVQYYKYRRTNSVDKLLSSANTILAPDCKVVIVNS